MDDQQLRRNLQTIGKTFFIKYFELLNDPSNSADHLVNIIVESEKYDDAWAKVRVDCSRNIFKEGRRNDALKIISESRLDHQTISSALSLLNNIPKSPRPSTILPPPPPIRSSLDTATIAISETASEINLDILTHLRQAPVSELLALYATTLDELRDRGIVRSANGPGGDYAELLFVQAFGWKRENNSVAGYDAMDAAQFRYQVKSRRLHGPRTSRQLSALRNFSDAPFDFLAGVLFNKDYSVMRAAIIPYNEIQPRFSKHTNSWIFLLEDRVWNLPGVRDVTQDLRSAAKDLDALSSR
jgi:hypothetical protein